MDYREPDYHRRAPRLRTPGWPGKCIVEDDPGAAWIECRLLDISHLGLGLELLGECSDTIIGRRLVVHIDVGGGAITLRVVGLVKRVGAGHPGWTRAGLEFEGLSERELSILEVMEHLKVGW